MLVKIKTKQHAMCKYNTQIFSKYKVVVKRIIIIHYCYLYLFGRLQIQYDDTIRQTSAVRASSVLSYNIIVVTIK